MLAREERVLNYHIKLFMSTYIFILGKDHDLSLAELLTVYPKADLKALGTDFVSLNLKQDFDQADLNRLGGVVKVARLINSVSQKALERLLLEEFMEHYKDTKLNYGVSVYDWSQKNLRTILIGMKKALKKADLKSRFANQDFKNISAAQYKGFRKKGVEWVVVRDAKCFLVGEVVAVQDIDAYSKRDYEKPFRDMQMGMLPPKLAQILINLTGVQGKVWDPFCGSGTVVMEGILMGRDMMGSDIDPKRVEGAKRNMEWLKREFNTSSSSDLFVHDATEPFKKASFKAIATESDLGIPHGQHVKLDKLKDNIERLTELYIKFFEALKEIHFKEPVVIALPFFRPLNGKPVEMTDAIRSIEALGFEKTDMIPKGLSKSPDQLKYARPGQAVGRDIYRFQLT